MNSEDKHISLLIILGITALALLILLFTGKYSLFIMLGVCFLVAFIISLLGSILYSWGKKNIDSSYFFLFLFLSYIIPCSTAYLLKLGFGYLHGIGLLTPKNILIVSCILFTISLYAVRFEKYKWTTHLITQKKDSIYLLSSYIYGIKRKYESAAYYFTNRYSVDKFKPADNRIEQNIKYISRDFYTGVPKNFSIKYYSENEAQLYEGSFSIKKVKSES